MHCHIYVLLGVSGMSHVPWGPGMSVKVSFLTHNTFVGWGGSDKQTGGRPWSVSSHPWCFSPNGWIQTSACSTFVHTTATAKRKGHNNFHNNICLEAALSLTLCQRALSCFSGLSLTAQASSPESLHLLPSLFPFPHLPSLHFTQPLLHMTPCRSLKAAG